MRALAVTERDLRRFIRNPVLMIASVFLPLVYLVIIGNSFQGELKRLPLLVVDQDNGPYARRVVELLQAMQYGPDTIKVTMSNDQKEAVKNVRDGFYKGALIIPSRFSEDMVKKIDPQIGLFLDNTDGISASGISNIVARSMSYLESEYVAVRPDRAKAKLRAVELYKKIDYDASLVPGAIVMAIFMGTTFTGAFSLVMDKFLGVHESYLSTPLTKMDIVVGTIISGVFITTTMSFLVLIGGMFITGIKFTGAFTSLALLIFTISLTALGLLSMIFIILGRADHPRIVGVVIGFLNVIFYFPSGAVYPVESLPGWLRAFAKVNPEAYAVHALKALILKGAGFAAIQKDILFLVVFTAIMLSAATVTFKRTM
ncbi:MAG: ABC transporter permease [Candidatus Omnitrophota bacterium]